MAFGKMGDLYGISSTNHHYLAIPKHEIVAHIPGRHIHLLLLLLLWLLGMLS
jgi:hypothetical protein